MNTKAQELIKTLRTCAGSEDSDAGCVNCIYTETDCAAQLMREAADCIEQLISEAVK